MEDTRVEKEWFCNKCNRWYSYYMPMCFTCYDNRGIKQTEEKMLEKLKQSPLEWYIEQVGIWAMKSFNNEISVDEFHAKRNELEKQALEMEVAGKESSYADGFSAGYDRALELVEWKIKHELKIDNK